MRRPRPLLLISAVVSATLWAYACGDGTTEPPPYFPEPTAVTVSPATAELTALGATVQLSAEVRDQNGAVMSGATVTWASSDAGAATVNASGLVTAASNGGATITATAGSASGSTAVTVAQVASAVAVSPAADTLLAFGDTLHLVAEATDANGHAVAASEYSWASSDTLVARVDASGRVTATANGSATITAAAGSASGSAVVTVAQVVNAVVVSPAADTLAAFGDTLRLVGEATDANGHAVAASEYSWASSDTLVARVDASGQVTAAANGSATITATAGSVAGSAVVTVAQVVNAVSVSPAADTLLAFGDTVRLIAEATDANGHAVAVSGFTWMSSDTLVARVDASGLVESAAEGRAVVTATASDVAAGADISVIGSDCTTYFEITYDNGGSDCIRVPRVVFTFTPRSGQVLTESRWDPTEVIKIHFDTDVVYLSESGDWRDITEEDILDMVEISQKINGRTDHVSANGVIHSGLVSAANFEGRTVVTLDSPYDPRTGNGHISDLSTFLFPSNIIVSNFAGRADVSKIAGSNSVSAYLTGTRTFYHGDYGARYYDACSCDLEYRPSTASDARYGDPDGQEPDFDLFEYEKRLAPYVSSSVRLDDSGAGIPSRPWLERADPATRYVIDVAFVVADTIWREHADLKDRVERAMHDVSKMYQFSGVNVELRASAIEPFSVYRQHLLCDLPDLSDDLVVVRKRRFTGGTSYGWSSGAAIALLELIPAIRARNPADIVIGVVAIDAGGFASGIGSAGGRNLHEVARWESFAFSGLSRDILAHEIGHVLGLHHDLETLVASGLSPSRTSFAEPGVTATGFGYGYAGRDGDGLDYGTIMSYARWVPLFSADREIMRSDLCAEARLYSWSYCKDSESLPDRAIRLGGPYEYGVTVDASESLQYIVGRAAVYSEAGVAPLDLSTVSNSVTAKTLRAGPETKTLGFRRDMR